MANRSDALRPRGFIVLRTFYTLVVQVAIKLPSFSQQHVAEIFYITQDLGSFASADVQPNARSRLDLSHRRKTVHHPLVPPHRRRKCRQPAKYPRELQAQVKRGEA